MSQKTCCWCFCIVFGTISAVLGGAYESWLAASFVIAALHDN